MQRLLVRGVARPAFSNFGGPRTGHVLDDHRPLVVHLRPISTASIRDQSLVRSDGGRKRTDVLRWRSRRCAHVAATALRTPKLCPAPPQQPDAVLPEKQTITLRPYQQECLDAIKSALERGVSRIGVSSPTGSGKTTIFSELVEHIKGPSKARHRVMILVSAIQLAQQTANHLMRRFPDLWVEIEQGSKYHASGFADVTVATYQTLISKEKTGPGKDMEQLRLEKFDPHHFKAVIVDEAHHAATRSWRLVLNHFDPAVRVEAKSSDTGDKVQSEPRTQEYPPIIGFSATFSRHDGLSLGSVFEEIVFHKDVLDLIDEEWLSPLRFTSIQANVPLDTVSTSSGRAGTDFVTTSLARAVNTPAVNRLIVRTWLSRTQNKAAFSMNEDSATLAAPSHTSFRTRTLVFAVNVQHVHDLTDEFRAAGIDARPLTGTTPVSERAELLEAFAQGMFPVLVNCAILTEGADIPSIDCVLIARPTLSRNLFSQMIGRGMRLSPLTGKQDCLVLDLVGTCSKGLVCAPTLFGLDPTEPLDDVGSEEMFARRAAQTDADAGSIEERQEWARPQLSQDPTDIKFVDWSSAKALHEAMRAKALFSSGIERFTSSAWIDCGDDVYVIDVPPNRGFAKVERIVDDEAVELDADVAASNDGVCWFASFTEKNIDLGGKSAMFPPGRRRVSPYRRPRRIAVAESLEQATHAADTYIATHVLRNSGLMRSLMSRFAPWRSAPASTRQKAFVEKRLGLSSDFTTHAEVTPTAPSRVAAMTKGEAAIILTRLSHGGKSRWQREIRKSNRSYEKKQREAERRQRETVSVGKLSS